MHARQSNAITYYYFDLYIHQNLLNFCRMSIIILTGMEMLTKIVTKFCLVSIFALRSQLQTPVPPSQIKENNGKFFGKSVRWDDVPLLWPVYIRGDTRALSASPPVWATATCASDGHPVIDEVTLPSPRLKQHRRLTQWTAVRAMGRLGL